MAISAGTVAAALTLDTGQFDGALKQSRTLMETFSGQGATWSDKFEAIGTTMQSVGKAATLTVTSSMIAAGTAATRTFTSFDDGMRQVRATMNATEADTAKLTAAAKQYGATTKFTATQSAEALNYLALAGYNADKAISALPTVLNLAQAGAMDLGYASDLVTDSMSALGLEMDQLSGFCDQLAVTSQKSNTNIAQLGEAILTVGGTAKALAGGTAELNAELGILADAGIKGAEGGTHLRNVILALQSPTEEAAELLAEYTEGVYDAEGRMRSLDDIFQALRDSMAGMTDAEQQSIIGTIFNKTDLAAAQTLIAGCGSRFAELTGYIEDSEGAAEQMAETLEGGIGGAFRSLSSSVEAVGIAFGETLAPGVQWAAEQITGLARGFASLDEGMRSTIVWTAAVAAAAGPALLMGSKIISVLTSIGSLLAAGSPVGWIAGAVVGLAALSAWATRDRSELTKLKDTLAETNAEGLEQFMQGTEGQVDVPVDVKVHPDYSGQASTLYDDIFTWLTDGEPDTEAQKQELNERVRSYFDELLSEVNQQEQDAMDRLGEQYTLGFIDYDTYIERTGEVIASAQAARTELGTLCDESLAFVASYAGQPAGVVQEAYDQIDALEKRTDALLEKVGLATETLQTAEGETAVKLTKAGATGDVATYGSAFSAVAAQREQRLQAIRDAAEAEAQEANRIWTEVYTDAQNRGDEAAMERANQARDAMIAGAEATMQRQVAATEAGYVREFEAMFAGIASRFPEQAEALYEAMDKIDMAGRAAEMLAGGEQLTFDDLSNDMIAAMKENGVDVDALVAAMLPPDQMTEAVQGALRTLTEAGNIDIGALLAEQLAGTELGTALIGVIESGYLDALESVDMGSVDAQLALITGHLSETLGTGLDGEQAGDALTGGLAQSLVNGMGAVLDAGTQVGAQGPAGLDAGGMNTSTGSGYGSDLGAGVVIGINSQIGRVRAAAVRLANAATGALRSTWVIKSPSRITRWMGQMYGEGIALGMEDKYARVRDTMVRIASPVALGAASGAGTGGVQAVQQTAQAGAGTGTAYNITVQGATIRSEDEARELLKSATKYVTRLNRGIGR